MGQRQLLQELVIDPRDCPLSVSVTMMLLSGVLILLQSRELYALPTNCHVYEQLGG